MQNLMDIRKYVNNEIKTHEETYDGNNIRDFVDLYIQATREPTEGERDVITCGVAFRIILELFISGSETTYIVLDWAFLFMSEYPDTQKKCYNEITQTVGDRYIKYADRTKMNYVEATLSEILRLANVSALYKRGYDPFRPQHTDENHSISKLVLSNDGPKDLERTKQVQPGPFS